MPLATSCGAAGHPGGARPADRRSGVDQSARARTVDDAERMRIEDDAAAPSGHQLALTVGEHGAGGEVAHEPHVGGVRSHWWPTPCATQT